MVSASAIAPERIEWLWPGRIPLGALASFSGDPKVGKSVAALSLIAAVSRGGPLPGGGADGPAMARRGSAILLSAEDDRARTIVPRLLAAGADMDRVQILHSMLEPEFRGFTGSPAEHVPARQRRPTVSAGDVRAIERSATHLGDCRLIVFDPITAFLKGRNADMRAALALLQDLAERLGATVLLINHHCKHGASGTNGKYRVLGDIGYVALCRANYMFLPDPDDPTGRRRLMLDNGGNLGLEQPALPYVLRDEGSVPVVDWLPETIDLDADAALARTVKIGKISPSGKGARRRDCEEWLRGHLAGGLKTAKECEQAALEAGFSSSILLRARMALAVRCLRTGFGKGACYHWCLPETAIEDLNRPDSAAGAHALRILDAQDMQNMQNMQSMGGPTEGCRPWVETGAAAAGDEAASASEPV